MNHSSLLLLCFLKKYFGDLDDCFLPIYFHLDIFYRSWVTIYHNCRRPLRTGAWHRYSCHFRFPFRRPPEPETHWRRPTWWLAHPAADPAAQWRWLRCPAPVPLPSSGCCCPQWWPDWIQSQVIPSRIRMFRPPDWLDRPDCDRKNWY